MFRQFQKHLNLCSDTNLCWYHIPSSPRLTYTYALIPLNCDAPDLATGSGCQARVSRCDWDSLTFNLFFLRADTCIHMHNLCNNKNSFTYTLYTTILTFIIFYTPILESLLLVLLQNYTYKIRNLRNSAVSTYL